VVALAGVEWPLDRAVNRVAAMLELNGASAIVTGGASGLGEASVRALAAKGAKVVILDLDRQQEKGDALAKETGGVFAAADVTNEEQVIAAVEAAKELGPLRAVVNSAGIGWAARTIGRDGTYESAHNLELFREVIEINLVTFNVTRLARHVADRRCRRGRFAWCDRQHRVGRRGRRAGRPGGLHRIEGRYRGYDTGARP
jgi:NAD(P)-dependent dehydrogenase (short-subunit alcohol dehydrogenase family)